MTERRSRNKATGAKRPRTTDKSGPPSPSSTPGGAGEEVGSAYQEERRLLMAGELDYAKSFDRWMLVAAGSALGISVTFISDVVPLHGAAFVSWLALGWMLLVASITCVLVSLHVSQYAFQEYRDTMDSVAEERGFENFWSTVRARQAGCWRPKLLDVLNIGALVLFVLGLVLVVGFVIVNIAKAQGA